MTPLQAVPVDGAAGTEGVFAGEVDSDTARAREVLLWDDEAVILPLGGSAPDLDEGPAAAA